MVFTGIRHFKHWWNILFYCEIIYQILCILVMNIFTYFNI
jgi:hypothetical protein